MQANVIAKKNLYDGNDRKGKFMKKAKMIIVCLMGLIMFLGIIVGCSLFRDCPGKGGCGVSDSKNSYSVTTCDNVSNVNGSRGPQGCAVNIHPHNGVKCDC